MTTYEMPYLRDVGADEFYEAPWPTGEEIDWQNMSLEEQVAFCTPRTQRMLQTFFDFCDEWIELFSVEIKLLKISREHGFYGVDIPDDCPYSLYSFSCNKREVPSDLLSLYGSEFTVDEINLQSVEPLVRDAIAKVTDDSAVMLEWIRTECLRVRISTDSSELQIEDGCMKIRDEEARGLIRNYPVEVVGNSVWMYGARDNLGILSPMGLYMSGGEGRLRFNVTPNLSLFHLGVNKSHEGSGKRLYEEHTKKLRGHGWSGGPIHFR